MYIYMDDNGYVYNMCMYIYIYVHVILQVPSKTQFTMDVKCNFYDDQTFVRLAQHDGMADSLASRAPGTSSLIFS